MHRMRKIRRAEQGVSEVVATILILAITVTLFSVVIYWVWGMPAPTGKLTTTFEGSLKGSVFVVKHAGGDTIWDYDTNIFVTVTWYTTTTNSKSVTLKIHNDVKGNFTPKDRWDPGEIWSYDLKAIDPTITDTNIVKVTCEITSIRRNIMIWEGTFLPVGKHSPIILEVGVAVYDETRKEWFSSVYVFSGQNFKLFARVVDPDDDISRVWVGGKGWADLRYTSEDLTFNFYRDRFETTVKKAPKVSEKTNYTVTFSAVDSLGQTAENVRYTFAILPRGMGTVDVGQLTTTKTVELKPGYRVTEDFSVEVEFSNLKPTTGERIFITAIIRNIGDLGAENANVSFYDATDNRLQPTLIGERSISVPARGRVPVLMPWTPTVVGTRLLWINITDIRPHDKTERVQLGQYYLSNNASAMIKVYVYYDDLESGVGKWRHYATILRMNAEGALEFDNRSTNVDIRYNQDRNPPADGTRSIPFNLTEFDYHTKPRSYYAFEPTLPTGVRRPVDVTFMFDYSNSMNWDSPPRITYLKQAATHFVDLLSPATDRAALWLFGSYNRAYSYAQTWLSMGYTTNLQAVKQAINNLRPYCNTPGWDGAAIACQYTRPTGTAGYTAQNGDFFPPRPTPVAGASRPQGNPVRAILFLTDGYFNYEPNGYDKTSAINWARTVHQQYNVMFFAIGVAVGASQQQDLTDLATAGGGLYRHANNAADLDAIFQQIIRIIIREAYNQTALPDDFRPTSTNDYDKKPFDTYTYPRTPNARIPPSGTVGTTTDSISVPSSQNLQITDVRVYIRIDHTYIGDLLIDIVSPSGTSVRLHDGTGGTYDYIHGWYVNGDFNPDPGYRDLPDYPNLAVLNGQQSQGTWVLSIYDRWTGDYGYLREWQLRITGNPVGGGGGGGGGTGGGGAQPPSNQPAYMPPGNKSLVSEAFVPGRLHPNGTVSAKLTFYHKYNLLVGANGGAVMVGVHRGSSPSSPIRYYYITPSPPYTGNLNLAFKYYDDSSPRNEIRYVYNGVSGNGRYTWDYAEANITDFFGGGRYNPNNNPIRIKFQYYYCNGGSNGSWFIDDIEVQVTRGDSDDENFDPLPDCKDRWILKNYSTPNRENVHSASLLGYGHAWWHPFDNLTRGRNERSVDNSLITSISLVDVKDARLKAYVRFNINPRDGAPPHGFRVEVSDDGGITWCPINKGVRSGFGASGNDPEGYHLDNKDAAPNDGRSYAGIHETGDPTDVAWVPTTSLDRVECDLSRWAGRVILLKFRVILNNVAGFETYQPLKQPTQRYEWGVSIDDIHVEGNVTGTKAISPSPTIANEQPANEQPAEIIVCDKAYSKNDCGARVECDSNILLVAERERKTLQTARPTRTSV